MLWWHWHTEPELIGGLLLTVWVYAVFTGPLRSKLDPQAPFPLREAICFYSGIALFYLTVGSPLDHIGEVYLFAVRMIQHVLLMYFVPILLIFGLPDWLTRPALRNRIFGSVFRVMVKPPVAAGAFLFFMTAWHVPTFYEAALRTRWIHNVEHVTMFLPGFFVWWLLFSQSTVVPPLRYAGQILLVFALSLGKIPIAAFLTFAREVLYPTYEFAPRITSMSAHDDQVLGGVIMAIIAKFAGVFLIGYSFYRWYRLTDQESHAETAAEPALKAPQNVH